MILHDKKRLLIVEDEAPIRDSLTDFFTMQGYDVISSGDGTEGMRLALSEQPDLLILDVMLPGMHGFDVCRRLQEHGFSKPILFLTAKAEEVDKLTGFGVSSLRAFSRLRLLLRLLLPSGFASRSRRRRVASRRTAISGRARAARGRARGARSLPK